MKDDPSLVLFFNLGDEDELEWPNGGGNKGLFSNQPENIIRKTENSPFLNHIFIIIAV